MWTDIGWWYTWQLFEQCCRATLVHVCGQKAIRWDTGYMTDLKYPDRNVLPIFSGKLPKQHCFKKLPHVSPAHNVFELLPSGWIRCQIYNFVGCKYNDNKHSESAIEIRQSHRIQKSTLTGSQNVLPLSISHRKDLILYKVTLVKSKLLFSVF